MRRVLKWKFGAIIITAVIFINACGDDGIIEIPTADDYLQEDIVKINDYITEKGYTNVDTTESGVRFVIFETGDGDLIEYNDIVSMNYVGMYLDDSVFDTSIESVAKASDVYIESRSYEPSVFTHTATGWAIESLFVPGFAEGTTEAIKKLNVGGKARLMIPSTLGYGTAGKFNADGTYGILPNSVLVFDIYPVKVRKQ